MKAGLRKCNDKVATNFGRVEVELTCVLPRGHRGAHQVLGTFRWKPLKEGKRK